MSGMLSKAIKSNIITNTIKYKNEQEKIGEVIDADNDMNCCVVNIINRDGITTTAYNVKVQLSEDGTSIPWFPEPGDYVKLTEQYKRFVIIGKINLDTINNSSYSLYSDVFSDNTGAGGGFVGY